MCKQTVSQATAAQQCRSKTICLNFAFAFLICVLLFAVARRVRRKWKEKKYKTDLISLLLLEEVTQKRFIQVQQILL
jgi:hypothetical protein